MNIPPSRRRRCAKPRRREWRDLRRARVAAALLLAAAACAPEETPPLRPNVLLVSFDTTRADALSPYGAPAERTPSLARLARDAAIFETAISPAPLTLPAHATML